MENTAKNASYSSELAALSTLVRTVKDDFNRCAEQLDREIISASNINNRIKAITKELEVELASFAELQTSLKGPNRV